MFVLHQLLQSGCGVRLGIFSRRGSVRIRCGRTILLSNVASASPNVITTDVVVILGLPYYYLLFEVSSLSARDIFVIRGVSILVSAVRIMVWSS